MANLTSAIAAIALAALAGLAISGSPSPSVDLDDFSDERLMRDLEDELEDIYYDAYYGHQDIAYADAEVELEILFEEIMYALSDEGDGGEEEWDDGADSWDDDFEDEWEGEESWDGEEILFADLELEMEEAGTSLDAVVWDALMEAADLGIDAHHGGWRVKFAGVGLNLQDRNRRGKPRNAVNSTSRGIIQTIRASR